MGNLDYIERESSQIERKVKSKEQISQEQNSWLQNNAQNLSSQDLYSLIDNYSLSNPQIQTETQNFKSRNSKALNVVLTKEATPTEVSENPEITKKLNLYQNLTNNLKTSLKGIQNNLNNSTSLSLRAMDAVVWVFSDNNVFNTYASSFEITKWQARQILSKLLEIDQKILTPKQKEIFTSIQIELKQILSLKLEKTWIVQMLENEFEQIPQNLNYAANWLKWGAIWLYEWTKAIITWSVDLLTFMIKYPFNSKYRQEINKQAEIIYDFVKKEWLSWVGEKVYEAIWKEMDRISKLPPEKQAQAIWEIAWNVISMLAVVKAGTTIASKLWKVWQAEKLIVQAEATWNIARAEKIREIASTLLASKIWLKWFDIILTWVAESVLLKWLSVSYKAIILVLEDINKTKIEKINIINVEAKKLSSLKWNDEENKILEKYLQELSKKKQEYFEKLNQNEVLALDDNLRLEYWDFLLKRKLWKNEQKAIIEAHNIWEANIEWKFSIWDLRKKYIILKNAWFNEEEIMKLFENKVCGKERLNLQYNIKELYSTYPILKEYVDIFWENSNVRILWEWTKWLILNINSWKNVYKIPLNNQVENQLRLELEKTSEFRNIFEKWYEKNYIPEWLNIPKVYWNEINWKLIYSMEKIDWYSLTTLSYIEKYWELLKKSWFDYNNMSDYEIKENLVKLWVDRWYLDLMNVDYENIFKKYFPQKIDWFKFSLEYLKAKWFIHTDLHSWNIMAWKNWNIYIIDFDAVKIEK